MAKNLSLGRVLALMPHCCNHNNRSGNSSEEQFQQVYTTTLTETAQQVLITSPDMNGSFVDVVVCMSNSTPLIKNTNITVVFAVNEETIIAETYVSLSANSDWSTVLSTISFGGLLVLGKTVRSTEATMESGFITPDSIVYPTVETPGIAIIAIFSDFDSETVIPTGTTITVYARKTVQINNTNNNENNNNNNNDNNDEEDIAL